GEVADDEVDRRGDLGRVEGADVGAFQDAHARVVAKSPGQLSVPDVHGEDVRGSAAEQHVGEAAGGGTGVQAAPAGDDRRLRAECVERPGEFAGAARDVVAAALRRDHAQRLSGVDLPGGLGCRLPVQQDAA